MRLLKVLIHSSLALSIAILVTMTAWVSAEDLAGREKAAREATAAFLKQLGGTLKSELEKGDPVSGIRVCAEVAPGIANRISLRNGWRVTRVGTRVRNPVLGMPDAWEQETLKQFERREKQGEKFADMTFSQVVSEPNGRYYRFAKPIGVQPICLTCHGSREEIAAPVAAVLGDLYPHDKATGYRVGELRGAVSIKQPLDADR